MANKKIEKLEVHPLIAAQEQSGETTVEFRGFVGTGEDDMLRLYTDLGMSSYIDIPKDAVVYVEKDPDGNTGKVRAFISPNKKVTEVHKHTVAANASSFLATRTFINAELLRLLREGLKPVSPPPTLPWVECYNRCEAVFAQQAAEVLRKKNQAATFAAQYGVNSIQYQQANSQAIQAENQAVGALHECITQCQTRYPLSRILLGSVEDIVSRFIEKYLGKV